MHMDKTENCTLYDGFLAFINLTDESCKCVLPHSFSDYFVNITLLISWDTVASKIAQWSFRFMGKCVVVQDCTVNSKFCFGKR